MFARRILPELLRYPDLRGKVITHCGDIQDAVSKQVDILKKYNVKNILIISSRVTPLGQDTTVFDGVTPLRGVRCDHLIVDLDHTTDDMFAETVLPFFMLKAIEDNCLFFVKADTVKECQKELHNNN
jgi:hypothetical protein